MTGGYRRPTTPQQRARAAEAREAKLAALHQTLTEQVSALGTGPEWRRWLDVAGKFHNYSFRNTLLLRAQKPDATQVAGYNLWQELGRHVTKGEKGLTILAPVTRKLEPTDGDRPPADADRSTPRQPASPDDTASTAVRRVVGFRPAYVWDISQTSGDPLPTPPRSQPLTGQAPDGLWDALAAQCAAAGFTVTRQPIAGETGPHGYTAYATREVVVRSDIDDAHAVKTLAHELGHVLMHDPASFPRGETGSCRGAWEVEAESVAYLVAADHGLDTSEYTFAYVAGWAAQTGDIAATLAASGTRVLTTAHQVLDASHAHLTPTPVEVTEQQAADADTLTARATAGAERTAVLREAATAAPAPVGQPHRDRLLAANAAAMTYFRNQYPTSWAATYLHQRLSTSLLDDRPDAAPRVGYAPAGWTHLTEHLRGHGFTNAEIIAAGLGTQASTGRVVDRFRDRLMFPIRTGTEAGAEVVGFVGRRNPAGDTAATGAQTDNHLTPKYLNTAQTPLYTKGQHLFGLAEATDTLNRGGLAVLVEGPVDALAVDRASGGTMVGVAPLGTALTDTQAAQLHAILGAGSDRVVVATDADPAGEQAARRAYDVLTAHLLDPRTAALPAGMDPAQTAELHGPAALVDRLAGAQPMARQLVDQALPGRELTWVEERVAAARVAAGIIAKAPADTWGREIAAVANRTGLEEGLLRTAVADAIDTGTDALGRLSARDRRDDLDRGQHLPPTAADIASLSVSRAATSIRPTQPRPADTTTPRPPVVAAAAHRGARH